MDNKISKIFSRYLDTESGEYQEKEFEIKDIPGRSANTYLGYCDSEPDEEVKEIYIGYGQTENPTEVKSFSEMDIDDFELKSGMRLIVSFSRGNTVVNPAAILYRNNNEEDVLKKEHYIIVNPNSITDLKMQVEENETAYTWPENSIIELMYLQYGNLSYGNPLETFDASEGYWVLINSGNSISPTINEEGTSENEKLRKIYLRYGIDNLEDNTEDDELFIRMGNVAAGGVITSDFAIGNNLNAAARSIRIGNDGRASQHSIVLGDSAENVNGEYAVILGENTIGTSEAGIAIGKSAQVGNGSGNYSQTYLNAIAIGGGAIAERDYSLAIGYSSDCNSSSGISIGNNLQVEGSRNICIGNNCSISGNDVYNSILIGGWYESSNEEHTISGASPNSVNIGGYSNNISDGKRCTILGGVDSLITGKTGGSSVNCTIIGSNEATIDSCNNGVSIGSYSSTITVSDYTSLISSYNCSIDGNSSSGTSWGMMSIIAGQNNTALYNAYSGMFGGRNQEMQSNNQSVLLGGRYNSLYGTNNCSCLAGYQNSITSADYASIIAGDHNEISNSGTIIGSSYSTQSSCINATSLGGRYISIDGGQYNSTLGGEQCSIISNSSNSIVLGGSTNICSGGSYSSIVGGSANQIDTDSSSNSTIIGGTYNQINNSSSYSNFIIGGNNNIASSSNNSGFIGGSFGTINGTNLVVINGSSDEITDTSSNTTLISTQSNTARNTSNCLIMSGSSNSLGNRVANSIIIGSSNNSVLTNCSNVAIIDSTGGSVGSSCSNCSIINAVDSSITSQQYGTIIGGRNHQINNGGYEDFIGPTIIGGNYNVSWGRNSVTLGGYHNINYCYNSIVSGNSNVVEGLGGYMEYVGNNACFGSCLQNYGAFLTTIGHYNNGTAGSNSADLTGAAEEAPGTEPTGYNLFMVGDGSSSSTRTNVFRITGDNVYGKSAFNSSGADYAEFIKPWFDENPTGEDRVGYFVTVRDDLLYKAEADDPIVGITSGNPSMVGNGDEEYYWRWERDEFGRYLRNEEGNKIQSKDYDIDLIGSYVERKDRPEWSYVGMIGTLPVRDDGTCEVNKYCKCAGDGIATLAETRTLDSYLVIERVTDNVVKVILK